MNERIHDLQIQALAECATFEDGKFIRTDVRKGGLSTINTVFDRKKFAELIVKEMCDMMRQCQDDCDTGDASETNWGYIGQLQDWIDRFEKHFGVEE